MQPGQGEQLVSLVFHLEPKSTINTTVEWNKPTNTRIDLVYTCFINSFAVKIQWLAF